MKSKFIVVEGLDGSGKTTICNYIKKIFEIFNIKIIITREPGGTPLNEKIRHIIKKKNKNEIISDKAELLMFYALRAQSLEYVIKPSLKKGLCVISDRHDLSTYAYQGYNIKNKKIIKKISSYVLDKVKPDITLFLDIDPKISINRIIKRGKLDRIEKKSLKFFTKVRKRYLKIIKKDKKKIKIINTNKSIHKVKKEIKILLLKWLLKNIK
ncbi:Thymidylate kinase [Candidatus Annandia adelgestsuga]|uniref:Thymidylate kinase n=1 Tax=Candidatus Annandia adelgestsuga TaxID=1302411 RepID=A0A3S9J7W4_9ENTR|nr:dTMP kinase [Candidatus Annandia adelgestsuga]AZP36404.1 Thymidylate kinase [Candidatus Annandia adelgestsuga]